jgi:telomere length regulation protein
MLLFTVAKSSIQTHGTSNRLKASSERAQWLGMLVAMALSELTDKSGSKLVFDDESLQTSEAQWYQSLLQCEDKLGDVKDLEVKAPPLVAEVVLRGSRKPASRPKQSRPKTTSGGLVTEIVQAPSISRIIELEDDEGEDEDLTPYAKPDSDPEDEDEDPTLVNRDKPKAPVYIRDLLTGLRESQNYDKHRIALETASALIRRKATFGKEVSDHAAELLAVFMNLNDTFEMDDFLELRQEAMISLVVAQPKIVAPLIAGSSLEGNYSIQQRAAMLTALAMGARELAGHKDEDRTTTPQFPSKELPEHLKQVYDEHHPSRLNFASRKLEQSMVQPMALTAADQLTGPNTLKVRTFSSRMEVQKKKSKIVPNALAKNVAEWFFMPLIGGWWAQRQSM